MLWNTISGVMAILELASILVVLIWFSRAKMGTMSAYNLVQSIFNVYGLVWCVQRHRQYYECSDDQCIQRCRKVWCCSRIVLQ